jgi:hypothetical protein
MLFFNTPLKGLTNRETTRDQFRSVLPIFRITRRLALAPPSGKGAGRYLWGVVAGTSFACSRSCSASSNTATNATAANQPFDDKSETTLQVMAIIDRREPRQRGLEVEQGRESDNMIWPQLSRTFNSSTEEHMKQDVKGTQKLR